MAINAPLHQKCVRLKSQRHLIHGAMTSRATDAFVYVNAVIEVGEIPQPVHFYPLNGLIGTIAFAHRLQISGVIEQHGMAIHAGLGGRNSGGGGDFNRRMTIAAIDSVVADVMFVTELDRLFARDVLPRQIRRTRKRQYSRECQSRQKNCGKKAEARDEIRAAVKNLGHVRVALAAGIPSTTGAATRGLHPQHRAAQARVVIDAIVSTKTF